MKKAPPNVGFILGRETFASISAVEGIRLSKRVSEDLGRTVGMPAEKRRAVLAAKYGKN